MIDRRKLLLALPAAVFASSRAVAEPIRATLGTSSEGGSFLVYSVALLDALRSVDPTFELRARPTKGTRENVALLQDGEIDVGLVSGEVVHELLSGDGALTNKLTVVTVMYPNPGMFAVRAESRYRHIADLKGRPVVWTTRTSGFAVQARYVTDGLGLDMDKDFESIYVERLTEGPELVISGRAAALWGSGLRWPGFVDVANAPGGGRFVVPTSEEIERIRTKYPFMARLSVPAGLYPGQYDALETIGTWSYIMARPGLPDPIGHRLAAAIFKAERTGALTKQLAQTTAKNTLASIPGPEVLQPGVAQFFKETGLIK